MAPIQELLNRIRWDKEFACGKFELGYFDRVEDRIIVMPFREIDFSKDDPKVFRIVDEEGIIHCVPLHRIRVVYKDGQRIWYRDPERHENR